MFSNRKKVLQKIAVMTSARGPGRQNSEIGPARPLASMNYFDHRQTKLTREVISKSG